MSSNADKENEIENNEAAPAVAEAEADTGGEAEITEEKVATPVDFLARLKIAELEKKVADYESKIGGIRDYVKNMESEMEAARLRAQRDQERLVDQKVSSFFKEILPVADNLVRSLAAAENEKTPLAEGIRLVNAQLQESLQRLGLEKINAKGENFDPEIHEALTMMTTNDESLDQKVIEEVQAGFRYKGSLLRPSQVVVGKKTDS